MRLGNDLIGNRLNDGIQHKVFPLVPEKGLRRARISSYYSFQHDATVSLEFVSLLFMKPKTLR